MTSHKLLNVAFPPKKQAANSTLDRLTKDIAEIHPALFMSSPQEYEAILSKFGFTALSHNLLQRTAVDFYLNTHISSATQLSPNELAVFICGFKLKRIDLFNEKLRLDQRIAEENSSINNLIYQINLHKRTMEQLSENLQKNEKDQNRLNSDRQHLIDIYYGTYPALLNRFGVAQM